MNYEGLKDDVARMLAGGRCFVDPTGFQNDMSIIHSKDDVFTVLLILTRQRKNAPNTEECAEK